MAILMKDTRHLILHQKFNSLIPRLVSHFKEYLIPFANTLEKFKDC